MRLALEASQAIQLEPILVAEIDGSLFVVDGHHRLKAYQLAGRETIPARVYPMGHREAVLVSKLVNCAERALEMHAKQKLDAAWQYLAAVTHHGAIGLPVGESTRTVGGRFGIGHATVARMLRKLPTVNPQDWSPEALDPGTGWPRWRYVYEAGAGWQMKEKLDMEQLTQHNAEKLARRVGALLDKATPEEIRRAIEMLGIEAQLEMVNEDAQDFAAATAEPSDF
jgi:ParB-like chromosome segregation protein Spo0J